MHKSVILILGLIASAGIVYFSFLTASGGSFVQTEPRRNGELASTPAEINVDRVNANQRTSSDEAGSDSLDEEIEQLDSTLEQTAETLTEVAEEEIRGDSSDVSNNVRGKDAEVLNGEFNREFNRELNRSKAVGDPFNPYASPDNPVAERIEEKTEELAETLTP